MISHSYSIFLHVNFSIPFHSYSISLYAPFSFLSLSLSLSLSFLFQMRAIGAQREKEKNLITEQSRQKVHSNAGVDKVNFLVVGQKKAVERNESMLAERWEFLFFYLLTYLFMLFVFFVRCLLYIYSSSNFLTCVFIIDYLFIYLFI